MSIGAEKSNSKITSIDAYCDFGEECSPVGMIAPVQHDYMTWQKNILPHCDRIHSMQSSSVGALRRLVIEGKRYDLIFLDTTYALDAHSEIALISCLSKENSILVLNNVINSYGYNFQHMMCSWGNGLKFFLCNPRFANNLAIANFKTSDMPINAKYDVESSMNLICRIEKYLRSIPKSVISIELVKKDSVEIHFSISFD